MPAWSSEFRRFTRSWHFFFFPCVLIYCPSGKPSKVLNLVGTLASPCSDLYSVSLLKPLSHSTASLVKISRGHAEIKLETCWLCKWNIKMEFLKVPPPRSSIFKEGGCCIEQSQTIHVCHIVCHICRSIHPQNHPWPDRHSDRHMAVPWVVSGDRLE